MENQSEEQTQVKPNTEEGVMYKSRLNDFIQKSGLPFPEYQTTVERLHNPPCFRSSVLVNGKTYETQEAFPTQKAAEREAARLALQQLTGVLRDEAYSIIEDLSQCKAIINEYATKLKLQGPEYTTVSQGDVDETFISSVFIGGKLYTGEAVRSKKKAEQLAAGVAIRSLIESGSEVLCEIINLKTYDTAFQFKDSGFNSSKQLLGARPGKTVLIILVGDGREVEIAKETNDLLIVDAPIGPSMKELDISHSVANLENVDTVVSSSGENKRKRETEATETDTETKKQGDEL